jgi:ABC-type branched-subunit amino acid transport system ATPase component
MAGPGVLRIDNVSKSFGALKAVDGLSFSVEPGQLFGVIGPNGAGKTTLLNCISSVFGVDSGAITLDTRSLHKLRAHQVSAIGVARTFQAADYFGGFTVFDYALLGRLRFGAKSMIGAALGLPAIRRSEARERRVTAAALEQYGLLGQKDELASELPYGTRKLLDVVRAVLMDPSLLLLDEPTSGTTAADRQALRTVLEGIAAQKITTVVVDHDVSFVADTCHRALAMNFGRELGQGKPAELLARHDVREAYIGLQS